MANPSGKKGAENEEFITQHYLLPLWPRAERRVKHGINDKGDFINCGQWFIEAKACETWSFPEWIRTITKRAQHLWFIIVKKDRRGPLKKHYVLVEADLWFEILAALPKEWLQ